MKMPIRRSLFWILSAGSAACVVLACSSAANRRTMFDDDVDGSAAALPEAAAPVEAGPAADSAGTKPPFDPTDEPVTCAKTPCAVQLVAGEHHFCARMGDGTVRCWGDDTNGSLGFVPGSDDGGADAGDAGVVAKAVTGLVGAVAISAGGTTTCALAGTGSVECWGGNDRGQLGKAAAPAVSDGDPHPAAGPVALGGPATRVDVGQRSACAVLTAGDVWCWGDNSQRQLARPTPDDVGGPAKAELGSFAVARTAAGTSSGFGITKTGEVVSWGAVGGPQGSVAARVASVSPDALPLAINLGSVTSFAVSSTTLVPSNTGGYPPPPPKGVGHACAVAKGEVYCWGESLLGALATGLPEPSVKPLRAVVTSDKAWPQQVAAGGDITCVRLTDGALQCAGDNTRGALGTDPKKPYAMFFEPATSFTGHAVQVAVGKGSVCALAQGGTVACWGSNEYGELGLGSTDLDPHSTPVAIAF